MSHRIRKSSLRVVLLASVLAWTSCSSDSDNNNPSSDGSTPGKEAGTKPPEKVECNTSKSDCKEYALNRFILPTNQQDSNKFAFQYNGTPYNKLGDILTFVVNQMKMPLQDEMDLAVNIGTVILLQRLKAKDFTTDPSAMGQAWKGNEEKCCSDETNKQACATEAASTCYNGSKEFTVDSVSPQNATFIGSISNGKMNMLAPEMVFELPLGLQGGTLKLTLKHVQVKGTLQGDTIKDGSMAGAMSEDEVNNNLIPSLVKVLDDAYTSADTKQEAKDMMKMLDTDKNGKITLEEVKTLFATFLQGDLDLDGDKKNDHLSFGVGYTGIKCTIKQ